MSQRIRKWTSQTWSFSQQEKELVYQDCQTIFQPTNTMHTGSNEIGLEEVIKFKGKIEFSFEPPVHEKKDIELSKEKPKKVIKSETRNGKSNKRNNSTNLF